MSENTRMAELLAMLKRAEMQDREALKEAGAEVLGDMFEADNAKTVGTLAGPDPERVRDELRSKGDSLRHNELEALRLLGNELGDDEEAERLDLQSRRTETGYYTAPSEEAA
ncbi:MAG: hypothetical protein JWP56_3146 [Aeromicrobium sp.]|nr:hypothetical protein [Aeromicrobium sp.]